MSELTTNSSTQTKMKEVYDNLPKKEADRARAEIIKQCGITYPVFWNWLKGITPVPKLCRIIVSNELKTPEFILFEQEKAPKQTVQ